MITLYRTYDLKEPIKLSDVETDQIYFDQDGHQVVTLTNDEGETCAEYLYLLMTKTYNLNPHKFQNLRYKDGDPRNCSCDNIQWY